MEISEYARSIAVEGGVHFDRDIFSERATSSTW